MEDVMAEKTRQEWLDDIAENAEVIINIPDKFKTQEFYNRAFDINTSVIFNIPDEFETPPEVIDHLKDDGDFLDYMPEKRKTVKLCLAATYADHGNAWPYIPKEIYRTVQRLHDDDVDPESLDDDYVGDNISGEYIIDDDGCLESYYGEDSEVIVPDGVLEIGPMVFYDKPNITTVYIPDSVKKIWQDVFRGCTNLREISIPKGVEMSEGAFNGCSAKVKVRE
jgi:hypothetical protein